MPTRYAVVSRMRCMFGEYRRVYVYDDPIGDRSASYNFHNPFPLPSSVSILSQNSPRPKVALRGVTLTKPLCSAWISVPGTKVLASGLMRRLISGLNLKAVVSEEALWGCSGGFSLDGDRIGTAAGPASSASLSASFFGFASFRGTNSRPYFAPANVVHTILGELADCSRMLGVSCVTNGEGVQKETLRRRPAGFLGSSTQSEADAHRPPHPLTGILTLYTSASPSVLENTSFPANM